MNRAPVMTSVWLGAVAGHEAGDYLHQNDDMAAHKQHRSPRGNRALARHATGYSVCQLAAKWAATRTAGVRVPWGALVAGQIVEGVLHAVIDDGRLLARYAHRHGKQQFHDTVPQGRALMDQAVHKSIQIPAGVVVTTLLATRKERAQ